MRHLQCHTMGIVEVVRSHTIRAHSAAGALDLIFDAMILNRVLVCS